MSARTTAAEETAAVNPTGDTDCVSLLADLDAGKPCTAEAAAAIRQLIKDRGTDQAPEAGWTIIESDGRYVTMRDADADREMIIDTEAPAREGEVQAIVQAEYDHWIKAALKHKRPAGLRSDHAQADLERAKVAKRILDKIAALPPRHEAPAEGAGEDSPITAAIRAKLATVKATDYHPGTPAERMKEGKLDGLNTALAIAMVEDERAIRARSSAPEAKTPHDLLTRIAKAASEGVAKNAGIVPQLAFAPILWALEDGFSGSKLKPATMKDVLLAAAQSRDLHMSDRLALEWCAEQPEALAALKAAADGSAVIGDGSTADKIIDGPGAWMFRIDGKWELSITDPRERLTLAPEDVISVPISAQPTADFVAKAKHLLSLAEEAEDKALVGDEGCVWPVEALRAAYAALPFVMTITLGGKDA